MRKPLLILALMSLGACSHTATVPMVNGAGLASVGAQERGHYAAMVQSGGWDISPQVFGNTCSGHSYSADLNGPWEGAMKDALTAGLEKVEFIPNVLSGSELQSKGYDAEIGITPFSAASQIQFTPGSFSGDASSQTKLEAILTIAYKDGKREQQSVSGVGTANAASVSCSNVSAVEQSSSVAIQDIVQRATLTTKLLLSQSKQK